MNFGLPDAHLILVDRFWLVFGEHFADESEVGSGVCGASDRVPRTRQRLSRPHPRAFIDEFKETRIVDPGARLHIIYEMTAEEPEKLLM